MGVNATLVSILYGGPIFLMLCKIVNKLAIDLATKTLIQQVRILESIPSVYEAIRYMTPLSTTAKIKGKFFTFAYTGKLSD